MTQPETSAPPAAAPLPAPKAEQLAAPVVASSSSASSSVAAAAAQPIVRPCGCRVGAAREGVSAAGLPVFTKEELAWPPSVRRGMTLAEEHGLRQSGCNLIQKLGESLSVPQATIATASLYFHVFYTRMSFQEHDWELMAMTALFLAGKVEDSRTPIKQVLAAFYKHRGTAVTEQEMEAQRDRVFKQEALLLDATEYNFSIMHPYNSIKGIIKDLCVGRSVEWKTQYIKGGERALPQVAWLFINDSLRTNACLVHPPQTVAIGCVFLANEFIELPQPTVPLHSVPSPAPAPAPAPAPRAARRSPNSPSEAAPSARPSVPSGAASSASSTSAMSSSSSSAAAASQSSPSSSSTAEGPWYSALYKVEEPQVYDITVRLLSVLPGTLLQKVNRLVPRAVANGVPYPQLSLLPPLPNGSQPAAPAPPAPSPQPRRKGQFPTLSNSPLPAPPAAPGPAHPQRAPAHPNPDTPIRSSSSSSITSSVTVSTTSSSSSFSSSSSVSATVSATISTAAPAAHAPNTPAPKRPHAATGPSPAPAPTPAPSSTKKHPERQPCPRCKRNLTKQEYEAHREACKAQYSASHSKPSAKAPSSSSKAPESKKASEDDPFMGAGSDPKRHKSSHHSSSESNKRPRESSSSSTPKKPQSSPSKPPRSSSASSATAADSKAPAVQSVPVPESTSSPKRPSAVSAPPLPLPTMNGNHSTVAVAPPVEANDVEMRPAEASAVTVPNGSHPTSPNAQRQSPQSDPHPDLSLSANQPRDRDPDSDGAGGSGSASQKSIHSAVSVSLPSHDGAPVHSQSNDGSSGSNGAGNSDSSAAVPQESVTVPSAHPVPAPLPPHSAAEDESGSPRSLKRRKAANGSATEVPLVLPRLDETEVPKPAAAGRTDDWESSAPVARDEFNGMSPATRHLESDDSNIDSQLGSPTTTTAPIHAFHSTDAAAGTYFVPLNGDVNHATAATRNEHFVHITSSPMVATNQN